MVSINSDECKRTFRRKGFKTEEGQKHTILYFETEGKKTPFKTQLSRGGHGKKLDDYLISSMAQQLKLTKQEFMGFYDCTLEAKDYIGLVKKNLGKTDPLDLL